MALRPFAHDAQITLDSGADPQAPGAAITVTLCGHWDHDPPCPLAPHHTAVTRDGDAATLRILFAAQPHNEAEVRRRIDAALACGEFVGPDGLTSRWQLLSSGPSTVTPGEAEHAARLAGRATTS